MQDFFLCPPRLESLFSPVLWKSCKQIPMAFKAIFPGGSQSLCQVPRLGSLMCSSEPSQYFFGILFSSLWVTHLAGIGFNFNMIASLLPSHCGFFFVFVVGYLFFAGFQYPPVNGCSIARCSFAALTGENEHMSFDSAMLIRKPREGYF